LFSFDFYLKYMLNLIIFGSPGAGKGTQAKKLAQQFNLKHVSSGEILRRAIKSNRLDKKISTYLDAGKLVPDTLIITLMTKRLEKLLGKVNLIFDGYPRTLKQAKMLDEIFQEKNIKPALVISLDLENNIALQRILDRSKNSNRSDDILKVIKKRLKIYEKTTAPILKYYEQNKRLIKIDGRANIDKVNEEILIKIKKRL
ncbi:MAG: adenylate kinase, partial [Patescibacteria group bacterium]|nr:adenylate kinase [Patescibacteria group bacterium]MDD3939188.1 adenylate kinase [Patescibacteria group bacterium]